MTPFIQEENTTAVVFDAVSHFSMVLITGQANAIGIYSGPDGQAADL
jgi:hypothetical protein